MIRKARKILISFALDHQSELDHATDGLCSRHPFGLTVDPFIDRDQVGCMLALTHLRALASGDGPTALLLSSDPN